MTAFDQNRVYVVGMGMSASDLTPVQSAVVAAADILFGGQRHLNQFGDLVVEKRAIEGALDGMIDFLRQNMGRRRMVVLASGDPLLFGIGDRIGRDLGCEHVVVLPNISSVAAAFARLKMPWSETAIVSLHNRDRRFDVLSALKINPSVAVLTDHRHSPQWLAGWLIERGAVDFRMAVLEQLGTSEEHVEWFRLEQAASRQFAQPALAVLTPLPGGAVKPKLYLGMADEAFDRDNELITKSEVRAVSLARLALKPGQTLWDLGAGSGSVGIEASVLLGNGRIIAVEQHTERVNRIRQNALKFGVYNHETIQSTLPQGLDQLRSPDRIFIGGGGKWLADIVAAAVDRLNPGGVVVVNTVLLDNITRITDLLYDRGLETDVVQVQVARGRPMPWSRRLEALNPVFVISGRSVGWHCPPYYSLTKS